MAPRARPAALAFLVALPLLAGCMAPEPEEQTLLQESVEVGERLYSWGDEDFHEDDVGHTKTIRSEFHVPGDIGDIGIRFAGRFEWANVSSAVLTVSDPMGNEVLRLNATEGNEDDIGTIHEFWSFDRVVSATSGTWTFAMRGQGNIGQLDFLMHGIESRETINQRTFRVDDVGRDVTVRVYLNGYGEAPRVFLDHPNGTAEPLPLNQFGEEVTHTFDPDAGTYRVRANTTGWGGNLAFQVKQAA